MGALLGDVRRATRALRRTPGFALASLLTLALGIGANTAIFAVVNGVLLRPLTYPHPDQLMYVTTVWNGSRPAPLSVMEYLEFQQFNRSFAEVGAFRLGEANFMVDGAARRVRSATVDTHLLNALGVHAAVGRLFSGEETGGIRSLPVAVLSYELWQSTLGGRPAIGTVVNVDGQSLRIVGVMERAAELMDQHTEIWLPLAFSEDERLARNNHNHYVIGRLRDGVTVAAAKNELDALNSTWVVRTGITPGPGHSGHVFVPLASGSDGHILQMTSLEDEIVGETGRSIWMLQAVVGLVFLIAFANVANLFFVRAEQRRREFAVHSALGAGSGHHIRSLGTESVILSIVGGVLGVLLAFAGVNALGRMYPDSLPRITEVSLDANVILASSALSVGCGLFLGLASFAYVREKTVAESLKSSSRGTTSSRQHVHRGLVIVEVALTVIVVASAGLLLRTVRNLTAVDVGFTRSSLVTFSVTLPRASFELTARTRAYQRLLDDLRAMPGVVAASAMTALPLDRPFLVNQTEIANSTESSAQTAPIDYQRVMSGFFETMGLPIRDGRGFESADAASRGGFAVVNETLAQTYWKGMNPIGQQLRPGGTTPWLTVIGVAGNVKQTGVDQSVRPEAYVLVDQIASDSPTSALSITPTTMHMVMRTALPLATLAPEIARVVRNVDPAIPVARLRDMDQVFAQSIGRPRLLANLLTLFSVLALFLAAIGVYAVLASMVLQRRREIGIRMAVGATPSRVLVQVMRTGLLLTTLGVGAGIVGVVGTSRLLASLLFGVAPTDMPTLAGGVATIVCVAALACWLPAWRASRVDPVIALRAE